MNHLLWQCSRRCLVLPLLLGLCLTCQAQGSDDQPLYTQQDMMFLINMITHHQQALDMSALVPGRIDEEAFADFSYFAEQVGRGQAAEIRMMESLLDLAASRGLDPPMERTGHDHNHMTGMLTPQQMEELAATRGEEFIRLWLNGMIFHHEGAIMMANAQQQHQLESGRRPYGMDVLVEEIIVVQRAEIDRMRKWLEQWNLR